MASISIVVVHRVAVAYAVRPVDVCQGAAGQRNHVRLAGVQHGGTTDRVMQRAVGNNRQAAVFLDQRRKTESAALKGRAQCCMLGRMNVVRPACRQTLKVPSPRVGSAWLLSKVFTWTRGLLSPFRLGTVALLNRVAVAAMTRLSATADGLATDRMVEPAHADAAPFALAGCAVRYVATASDQACSAHRGAEDAGSLAPAEGDAGSSDLCAAADTHAATQPLSQWAEAQPQSTADQPQRPPATEACHSGPKNGPAEPCGTAVPR
jgi:hypothetical protein